MPRDYSPPFFRAQADQVPPALQSESRHHFGAGNFVFLLQLHDLLELLQVARLFGNLALVIITHILCKAEFCHLFIGCVCF